MSLCVPVQKKCQREWRRATLGVDRTRWPPGGEHAPDLGDDGDVGRQVLGDLAEDDEIERGVGVGQRPRQVDVRVDRDGVGVERRRRAASL